MIRLLRECHIISSKKQKQELKQILGWRKLDQRRISGAMWKGRKQFICDLDTKRSVKVLDTYFSSIFKNICQLLLIDH